MRMRTGMIRALIAIVLAANTTGDTWQDAYRARDYERAAQLLHPIVMDPDQVVAGHDPAPFWHLATMYAQGLGVPRDPVGACALAHTARDPAERHAAQSARGTLAVYQAILDESNKVLQQHCGGLLPDDVQAAMSSVGCYAFAMPEEELTIAGRLVRVGRRGIRFADASEETYASLINCPMFVPRVRATTVEPPAGAPGVAARHFIEVFSWSLGQHPQTGTRGYALRWTAYEVTQKAVGLREFTQLSVVPEWPRTLMFTDADTRVSMEMTRDGRVQWRLERTELKGWLRNE